MIEFGKSLRLAREAKGYTVAQIAEMTHMSPGTVSDLEVDNVSRIPAAVYGRGFVKLYCEAVGLEAKPFIDEFMAIYTGSHDIGIRERKAPTPAPSAEPEPLPEPAPITPEPPPPPEPAPIAPESPTPPALAPVASEPPPAPFLKQPLLTEETMPPPPVSQADESPAFDEDDAPDARPLSRYAAPVRTKDEPSISPVVWRIGILGAIALFLLWGIVVGVRALYRATSDNTPHETPVTTEPAPQVATQKSVTEQEQKPAERPAAKPAAKPAHKTQRIPQKIPSLYLD